MISELRDLSCEERLKECGLTIMEARRLKGDQIEVSEIMNGHEHVHRHSLFSLRKHSCPVPKRSATQNGTSKINSIVQYYLPLP